MPQRKNEVLIEWMDRSVTPTGWTAAATSPLYGGVMPSPFTFLVPDTNPPTSPAIHDRTTCV